MIFDFITPEIIKKMKPIVLTFAFFLWQYCLLPNMEPFTQKKTRQFSINIRRILNRFAINRWIK